MTTRLVHRPTRLTRPQPQPEPRQVEAPPLLPDGQAGGGMHGILPVAGAMGSMGMMLAFRTSGLAAVGALVMAVTVLATGAMVVSQRGQATRLRRRQRERYLDYLERLREELLEQERQRRDEARLLDPPPAALLDVVRDPARLWERRRRHPDFLQVRLGSGTLPGLLLVVAGSGTAVEPADPFMLAEAQSVLRRFESAPGMPLRIPLDLRGDVSVVGDRAGVLAVGRLILLQTAALHAPEDVAVAVSYPPEYARAWAWASWLPHLADQRQREAAGPVRRVAPDPAALAALLADDLRDRVSAAAEATRQLASRLPAATAQRLLVVQDGYGADAAPLPVPDRTVPLPILGVTVVHLVADRLQEPEEVSVRVVVDSAAGTVRIEDMWAQRPQAVTGDLDDAPVALAEGVSRMLAPLRLSPESYDDGSGTAPADFAALLGVPDPERLDLDRVRGGRGEQSLLRVPLGVDETGRPVMLDLKEPAQFGMGPHGLCVGATGSGKSELLRTLVLALLTTHPPDELSMVLVDYKGGATFAPFDGSPHVAGVITNLEGDVGLVERVHSSLAGEVRRRQQQLADAGNVGHISDYRQLRAERAARGEEPPAPMPHLLVIIDEFGELLTAKPDFIELFLSIGRIGRSIGVHLLLSSQRIESGKLKGLETYLSYRLGLRTFSESESRTVLDTPDAYHLPPLPGFGYLKVDTTIYQRFKAAYVSGPARPVVPEEPPKDDEQLVRLVPPYGGMAAAAAADPTRPARRAPSLPTLLRVIADQLAGADARVAQIWLPPMPAMVTLDACAGGVRAGPAGLRLGAGGGLRVPCGRLDDPARQWQGSWQLDLAAAGGHVAVIGGPQSGKSTLLRTLMLGVAMTHTPAEVTMYVVDLVGGGMQAMAELPHVGGVAGRADSERVRRTVEEVRAMVQHRERVFRTRRIDSVDRLRAAHAAGEVPELPAADVVLVIDGHGQLGADFEEIEPLVTEIVGRGSGYGIHLVTAVGRWSEIRMAQQASFGTRLELRLSDPADSVVDRRLAGTLTRAGQVLTGQALVGQVALPRIDGRPETGSVGEGLTLAVRAVRGAWTGPAAPQVRVLPALLPVTDLPIVEQLTALPIGVDEQDLGAALLDLFGRDQHLLVFGDNGCGKTNLLRVVLRQLVDRYPANDLVFALYDPRRGLRDAVPEPYLGGYAHNAPLAAALTAGVARKLAERLPDDSSPPGSVPGPRVVVVIDDFDVLTASGSQPLAGYVPYLAAARDLGLHVVMTRKVAGASRGLYEPFTAALRESGAAGLVMSGDRSEGPLFPGVRAGILPPGRGLLVRQGERARTVQVAYAATVAVDR